MSVMSEYSGTITSGGTGQAVVAAEPTRSTIVYVNGSSGVLVFSANGTLATATNGIPVPANQAYEFPVVSQGTALGAVRGGDNVVPRGAISVYGGTTGQFFYVATRA